MPATRSSDLKNRLRRLHAPGSAIQKSPKKLTKTKSRCASYNPTLVRIESIACNGRPLVFNLKKQPEIREEFGKFITCGLLDLLPLLKVKAPAGWEKGDRRIHWHSFDRFIRSLNKAALEFKKTTTKTDHIPMFRKLRNGMYDVLKPVLDFCKDVVIRDENVLRVAATGNNVYGAVSDEQLQSFVVQLGIGPRDVVVDLGSGIGNIVCLLGAQVKKAVGIEIVDSTSAIAEEHLKLFEKIMMWLGVHNIKLHHGDIFDNKFLNAIKEATVIVANNKAFDPAMQNNLKTLLAQCGATHKVKVVTSERVIGKREERRGRRQMQQNELLKRSTVRQLALTALNGDWRSDSCPFTVTIIGKM